MVEFKRDTNLFTSEVEIPQRYTKDGLKDAELNNGIIVKEGLLYNPRKYKILQDIQRFYGKSGMESIDLDLKDCTGKYFEFEYLCENNLIKSAFNDNAGDHPLASFVIKSDDSLNEKWINYKPYDCSDVDGTVNNNTIKYSDVYTDTDIEYKNLVNSIKQYITLKSSSAPTTFDFTIKTCEGIELKVETLPILNIQYTGTSEAGTIEVTSNKHLIGRTAAATAFDLDLTNGNYDTLAEVATYIDNLSTWSAFLQGACGTCRSKTLETLAEVDCKTSTKILDAALKDIKAVNSIMPNSRTFWEIKRPFANSNRTGSEISLGFIELIPSTEHVNGIYDVIRITIDSSWVSSEFGSGATEIVIDPTTYRTIRDYGNITFCGDYASGNQHGTNGFMNGYGVINRGTEAVQTGGTRVEDDNSSITYIDPDGTEYAGAAAQCGVWGYQASALYSGSSTHWIITDTYLGSSGARAKLTFTGTEVWMGVRIDGSNSIFKVYVDGELVNLIDDHVVGLIGGAGTYQQKLLLSTGLSSGEHIVEVEFIWMVNISGTGNPRLHLDYFEYYTSGNELANKGAITINSRSTYGLDCTFAKHPKGIQYDARGNLYNDTGGDPSKGSFSCWIKPNYNYNGFTSTTHYIFYNRASSILSGALGLYYHGGDYKFYIVVWNGSAWIELASAVQSFSAGDILHLSMTWDETVGTQLFVNNVKTTYSGSWTADDIQIPLVIGNHATSPSSNEALNMIIAEPTFFDYVLTDEEVYDIYTSTKPIWEMDFGRRVEVLNRTNKGMLFNYSGVMTPDHRIGSFAGRLILSSIPSGTAITESQVTFSSNWVDVGLTRYTDDPNDYAITTFTGTEIWMCYYETTGRGIVECILDEGTSKEKHVLIDQESSVGTGKYALIATGLSSSSHTIKIRMKNLKKIESSGKRICLGDGIGDRMFIYNTSGNEVVNTDSLTFNNRLIDNVLKYEYSTMPNAIIFPDKGNISEYDHEGTIELVVKTTWVGDDSNTYWIFSSADTLNKNGLILYKGSSNVLELDYVNATSSISITGSINSTNWAANTEHHIIAKWWRPTSSTMGLTLYLDGVKLAENKSQSFTSTNHSGITIGNLSSPNSSGFNGDELDLSIHNHAFNDGGVAVSASAAVGSEVYNSYHGICRKYLEDLSSQVGDGSTTTFKLSRGLILNESDAKVYDDGVEATISSIKEGTYCRTNGAINSTDTTIVVDSWTNAESEIDINGGYLHIGQANNLWRKQVEYSSYDSGTNTFTIANSGTVGEDFVDNTIIEVCGTVTVSVAPAEGSIVKSTFYFAGDSVDREYGLISDRLNKNLFLDVTGNATSGWQLASDSAKSGMQKVYSNIQGQTSLLNIDKIDSNISLEKDTNCGIIQLVSNQGTKEEKSILLDNYNSSSVNQTIKSISQGLSNQSILRLVNGVDKNASSSSYYSEIGASILSSQYDLTKDALNSNDVNCVFDYSAIRVVDGQLDYDRDKSGNLQLAGAIDADDITILIDTDTAADLDRLGMPNGIIKVDSESIKYEDIELTSSTTATLLNCKRGYLAELTGGVAATHTDDTSIQLVGAWRNNVNAMNQSWYSSDGAFPYRTLLIGCGIDGQVEGGLIIRDLDKDSNYKIFEASDLNAVRGAVKCITGHTGKIEVGFGSLNKGMTDLDFINNEILGHGTSVGYGSAAGTKGTLSQVNEGLGWSYTTHTGVALNSSYVNDIAMNFDATNYDVFVLTGKSGTTGTSAGINRIYDGGDGILDTEYDLDADTSYWATKLCYDIANDDLYVSQTNGTADQEKLSKIGTPKIVADSTIDTADGTDRLITEPICNKIILQDANVWFATDSGAKKVVKTSFSSGATDTLNSSDFSELSIDICEAIAYDPDNQKLLLGFQNGSDGLLVECNTDGSNPTYYDKNSETDADRENVLSSDIMRDIACILQDYREIENHYTQQAANGWALATNSGLTIKEPEGEELTYSTHVDVQVTKDVNGVYTLEVIGVGERRETIVTKDVNDVYSREIDSDPNEAPMVDKIIVKDGNDVYTSSDPS